MQEMTFVLNMHPANSLFTLSANGVQRRNPQSPPANLTFIRSLFSVIFLGRAGEVTDV